MSSLLKMGTDLAEQSKAQQQRTGEMLKAAFSEHESFVKSELNESVKRIRYAINAHERDMTEVMESNWRNVLKMVGRTWLTIMMVSVLLLAMNGSILWWQGQKMFSNYITIQAQERTQAILSQKNNGVQLTICGEENRRCVKVNPDAGQYGDDSNWMILDGK